MEDEAASAAASEVSEVGVRMSFGPVLAEEGSNLDRWEPEEQRAGMQHRQGLGFVYERASVGPGEASEVGDDGGPSMTEKLLVVLLVACGTVCVLTNLLIVAVLARQKGRLCLRYQIMLSQSLSGLLGSSVIVYPLKILSMVLLDPSSSSHHARALPVRSGASSSSSSLGCALLGSFPLAAAALLSLSHAAAVAAEGATHKLAVQRYMVLVSSRGLIRVLLACCWLLPLSVALYPVGRAALDGGGEGLSSFSCYLPLLWSPAYAALLCSSVAAAAAFAAALFLALNLCRGARRFGGAKGNSSNNNNNSVTKGGGPFGDEDEDARPIYPQRLKHKRARRHRKKRIAVNPPPPLVPSSSSSSTPAPTAVVVIHPLHVPSSSAAASSVLASSEAFDQTGASLAQLLALAALFAPAVLHSSNFELFLRSDGLSKSSAAMAAEMDPLLPWAWLAAAFAGALSPVSHLLCDDVVSGLGLELFRDRLGLLAGDRWGGTAGGGGGGGAENEAFLGTQT